MTKDKFIETHLIPRYEDIQKIEPLYYIRETRQGLHFHELAHEAMFHNLIPEKRQLRRFNAVVDLIENTLMIDFQLPNSDDSLEESNSYLYDDKPFREVRNAAAENLQNLGFGRLSDFQLTFYIKYFSKKFRSLDTKDRVLQEINSFVFL